MKKLLALSLVLLMTILPFSALAEEPAPATLTVVGSAAIAQEPDMAQVSIGVRTVAATVAEASAGNAAALNQVIATLTDMGVADADMVTEYYNVSAQYDYSYSSFGESGSQQVSGYQVSNTLRVTVRQLDALGAILDAAMQAGANECYGVDFQSSQSDAANDEALKMAIAECERKAKLMAEASGHTLGRLVSITESYGSYQGRTYDAAVASAASTTILANSISFNASVEMVYELK